MLKAHPYEEPAYDIIPLADGAKVYGVGRVGYLREYLRLDELCTIVKRRLGVDCVNVTGSLDKQVKKIALCSGDGSSMITAVFKEGCDAYITGDISYHDACDARDMGLAVIDAGHFATENIYMPQLAGYLKEQLLSKDINIDVFLSSANRNPYIKV
jgi:putative NIF3 family GTP cyclohydrolase 1 type 2